MKLRRTRINLSNSSRGAAATALILLIVGKGSVDGRKLGVSERAAGRLARAREWLRRVMPRVALAAVVLFLLRLFLRDTSLYQDTPFGLLGPLTFFVVRGRPRLLRPQASPCGSSGSCCGACGADSSSRTSSSG